MKSVVLSFKQEFSLFPKQPFNFDGTFHKPSHFSNVLKLEEFVSGSYWQTLRFGEHLFGLRIEDELTLLKPKLLVSVFSSAVLPNEIIEQIKQEISYRFELDVDL